MDYTLNKKFIYLNCLYLLNIIHVTKIFYIIYVKYLDFNEK